MSAIDRVTPHKHAGLRRVWHGVVKGGTSPYSHKLKVQLDESKLKYSRNINNENGSHYYLHFGFC